MNSNYEDDTPFVIHDSLSEMIVVGNQVNLLLPWILSSRPNYKQVSYELDLIRLERSDNYNE